MTQDDDKTRIAELKAAITEMTDHASAIAWEIADDNPAAADHAEINGSLNGIFRIYRQIFGDKQ